MNLWLDDVRVPPDCGNGALWLWVKNYDEAIIALSLFDFDVISLDHDLGEGKTGYDVACWIEEKAIGEDWPVTRNIKCHSANPVGRKRINAAIRSICDLAKNLK
jgi:hypothetical protein